METTRSDCLLSVRDLSWQVGSLSVLRDVAFDLKPGEVLGVVGQRGAGKSTLLKLLSGVLTPQTGEIVFDDNPVRLRSVSQAQRLGIVAVHQPPELVDEMTMLTNVFLGAEPRRPGLLGCLPSKRDMVRTARDLLGRFDMPSELLEERVGGFSGEQRQIVALARALCRPSRLLLLDDALAALSYTRQQELIERLKALAQQDVAIVLSSDDLKQLFVLTDQVLVLHQGSQVVLRRTSETTPREIVEYIVGSNRKDRITPVIWAFENYYTAQQQVEELRDSQSALQQSLEAQDSLNRQLIERLQNQLDALDRLNVALQEASRRLITEREAERKALARELHDQVIQDLLSYNYRLEETENDVAEPAQRLALSEIRDGIRSVIGNLRQVSSDLRPPTIDNHGLPAAIRSLASQWSKRSGIPVNLAIDPGLGRLPETIELSVFRIVQEGLRNVRNHAIATQVDLSLERTPTASLLMRLADDGQGMDAPPDLAALTEQKHFGLVGISERVSLLDGTLDISSRPGGGLELRIEIPSPYPSSHG
jgi:signal transduction histidine kinase